MMKYRICETADRRRVIQRKRAWWPFWCRLSLGADGSIYSNDYYDSDYISEEEAIEALKKHINYIDPRKVIKFKPVDVIENDAQ